MRKIGEKWSIEKRGVWQLRMKMEDGTIKNLGRDTVKSPYISKDKIPKRNLHLSDGIRTNAKNNIVLDRDKKFKTVNRDFDPDIHVMVPHKSGKGFVQKLKSEI